MNNKNNTPKFYVTPNEDVPLPINTQFSGIFNKSSKIFTQENLNLLNKSRVQISSPQPHLTSESSNSTVETIDYEFLTPQVKPIFHTQLKIKENDQISFPDA